MALSRGARRCLKVLQSFLGGKNHCWPSQYTIAREMRCCLRTVGRHIEELRRAEIVVSTRKNRNTSYTYALRAEMSHRVSYRTPNFLI
jgi:hypothetical protein